MAERNTSTRYSRDITKLLVSRGMNLSEIARLLGVTKSYICRVKAGTRSFTLDHLAQLERAVGEPLPLLLIRSIPPKSVTPELRPLYEATLELLDRARPKPRRKAAVAA
jgi:transcriptional regulator with XRE-family HTH domain